MFSIRTLCTVCLIALLGFSTVVTTAQNKDRTKDAARHAGEAAETFTEIMNVKDKGLVVLTGCGHAGVVNTLKCAREMTGVNQIHAVIGGLHLTGPIFEPIIAPTIQALREFNPNIIVPQHCTGWKAMHLIAQEFPAAFIPNSVGTTMIIGG